MPGIPFGAAQTAIVPSELRVYEHITGFEFIEIDPNLVFPRSAAYRKTADGAQMRIRNAEPDLFDLELSCEEARDIITNLDNAGLFDWQRTYKPSQGTFVVEATEWRIEVEFDANISKRSSSFISEGENEFPDAFNQVVDLLINQYITQDIFQEDNE